VLLPDKNETVEKSARNIPDVKTLQASYLNVRDLLSYGTVLMPLDSLEIIQTVLG
jgi:large subunit ribosomal protein L4